MLACAAALALTVAPARLDAFIGKAMQSGLAPGLAIAVVEDGRVVHAAGYGDADREAGRRVTPRTRFYIASTTKALTALAAALLDARGAVDLDAPLSRALPAARLHAGLDAGAITVRDLLTHTHGIENSGPVVFRTAYSGEWTGAQLLELLAEHPPAPKGRAFEYGNLGYVLGGAVLEQATGKDWKDVVQREVIDPAGMKSTTAWRSRVRGDVAVGYAKTSAGFRRLPAAKTDSNMHAAGGHFSTVLDLARLIEAELRGGRIGGRQVFPPGVVHDTQRQQAAQDRKYGEIQRFGWGLGWDLGRLDGERLVHRFGGFPGYHSHLSFMPERGVGLAILVNESGAGGRLAGLVSGYAYELALGRPDVDVRYAAKLGALAEEARSGIAKEEATRAARSQALPRPVADYAGIYESRAYGRLTLTADGEGLQARIGALAGPVEVYDAPKEKLRLDLGGAGFVAEMVASADGVSALILDGSRFDRAVR